MAYEVIYLASLYCWIFLLQLFWRLVICLVIYYLLTAFVTVSWWKHFNCYHYIIIFVLMPISHKCIIWTVSYELLPSISNITLVLVDFLLTFDYLNSCFCRLLYWETTTDLKGSTFSWIKYSIFSNGVLSFIFLIIPLHMFPCICFPRWPFYSFASSLCNF